MKIIGVIPARYESTRLPGKPLADICGKPMIWWTYHQALKSQGLDDVILAIDDGRVEEVCKDYGMKYIMTPKNNSTGVERLSEVSNVIESDVYLLIQGDEPLIESSSISNMVKIIKEKSELKHVLTFKTEIKDPVDVINPTIIKIVTDLFDNILFASRCPIPFPRSFINFSYHKTVGLYAYPKEIMNRYNMFKIGPLEKIEDHDIIRLLENNIQIKAYLHETNTISVDTLKDLDRVRKIVESMSFN